MKKSAIAIATLCAALTLPLSFATYACNSSANSCKSCDCKGEKKCNCSKGSKTCKHCQCKE